MSDHTEQKTEEKTINHFGPIYFETQNLFVRPFAMDDIDGLFEILSNPQVHRYTKDKDRPWDRRRTEEYLQFFIDKGFASLDCFHGAVIEKTSSRIVGLTGLNPYKEKEPEIEWKLGVPYWNKGYATEIGKEMISEAFKTTNIRGIYGMAEPENRASRRVLQKIGMQYLGISDFRGRMDAFYYIGR